MGKWRYIEMVTGPRYIMRVGMGSRDLVLILHSL